PSLADLGDYLSKALAGAGLAGDPDATRLATDFSTLASQKLVAAPATPKPPHAQLKEATADCSRKQETLERAAKSLEQARLQLEKVQSKFDEAADAVMAAELHRLELQGAANPTETAEQSLLGVDPELFESLDELENDKQALEQFQKQLQDVTHQAEAKQKELQALLERARSAHQAAAKRRKRGPDGEESDQKAMLGRIKASAQAQAREAAAGKAAGSGKGGAAGSGKGPDASSFDIFGSITEWGPRAARFLAQGQERGIVALVETHKGEKDMPDTCQSIDKDGCRLAYAAARPSDKSERGLSGGEWILAKKHVATSNFESARQSARVAGRLGPCRGFAPTVAHAESGNLVLIAAYLQP
ncbi:unnamed protein product, partial [Prorocentrum cordatum]